MLVNKSVNNWNSERLNSVTGNAVTSTVLMTRSNNRTGGIKSDNAGMVRGTQLPASVTLKIGARIVMTTNVDTTDRLVNGAFGEVVDFEFCTNDSGERCLTTVLVKFDNPKCGRKMRKKRPDLLQKYPLGNVTPVWKYKMKFTLDGKNNDASACGQAFQFPLRLAYASTIHKIQGFSVEKPKELIIDLSGRIRASQAYVSLSRAEELQQITLIGDFNRKKLIADKSALAELSSMKERCLNNFPIIPFISCLNACSFQGKFRDVKTSPFIFKSEIVCIQETWFNQSYSDGELQQCFHVEGYSMISVGRGKGRGIAIYYKNKCILYSKHAFGTGYCN